MGKKILCSLWIVFCLFGIISNYKNYDNFDFLVIILFTLSPFAIYKIIKNKTQKSKISQSANQLNNINLDKSQSAIKNQNSLKEQNHTHKVETTELFSNDMLTLNMLNAYSNIQAQNDLRILNDCINLMKSTNNFETFFNRYELAMRTALTLQQAQQTGINIGDFTTSNQIIELKQNNLERILQSTYTKELAAINNLKTAKGKINRIDKLLTILTEHKEDLEFINDYNKIIKNLKKLKSNIKKEQDAALSAKYQAAYQASLSDAERIKTDFEALEIERYQIVGEPDCKHYKICAKNNEKVYPMSEYKVGQTAPPFHEQCTCIVVPYFEDDF